MLDQIKKALQEATDLLRSQASSIGSGAKEKTYQVIEDWLKIFPKLEIYGLEINSFALSVALSPALEVELVGRHQDFSMERLQEIINENSKSPGILSVFNTIKTTYTLHRKVYATLKDPLVVKIKIRLSPEIKVFISKPLIE